MAVYGIDLGTTYSCIARNDETGAVEALQIADNSCSTPSVVTFDTKTGKPIVGANAKNCMRTKPECTKAFVKRDMHKLFCDEEIRIGSVIRKTTPIEIQACILRHLIKEANILETGSGNKEITKAVITIPAKFDESQRARTKLAAEMAGIEVLGLLQEPTAAAIAYDIPAGHTVCVFDLGGGTLDVSIVNNDKGNYKVVGIPTGDEHLGGVDWDEVLLKMALSEAGIKVPDDQKKWNKLMNRTEECKKLLSQGDADLELSDEDSLEIEVSDFENASKKLLDRCINCIEQAIQNAKAERPNLIIDFFLTVGGSSKMPMIKKAIIKKYGAIYGKGKTEEEWLRIKDPDTSIAIGAAKYAQMLLNSNGETNTVTSNLHGIEDKATHSYGILVRKDGEAKIKNIMLSSDPMVVEKSIPSLNLPEDRDVIKLPIYENNSTESYTEKSEESRLITEGLIKLDKIHSKGTKVDLKVRRDVNGLIHIEVLLNGINKTLDINTKQDLIDKETYDNIVKSISLMN